MSSRKNGPKNFSGARGKKKAREVISRPGDPAEMTGGEVVQMLEDEGVSRIRKLMRPHDQLAVDTLAAIARDDEASAASRVTASTRILEYAHGKPVPIAGKTAGLGTGNGLTINVIKFYDSNEPVTVEATSHLLEE